MKKTLIILAAGMWSRFWWIKQVAQIGENGERLLDFTIQDALNSGFTNIIHVIRKEIESDYFLSVSNKYKDSCEHHFVYQELESWRNKPWWVSEALSCALPVLESVCAVVNADDYYGSASMAIMSDYLELLDKRQCCLMGYILGKTLSENGAVNRWICMINENALLTGIHERKGINHRDWILQDNVGNILSLQDIASMNFRGFHPDYLVDLPWFVEGFKNENRHDLNIELPLPPYIDHKIYLWFHCKVLQSPDQWIGITYKEDIEMAKKMLKL